MGLGLLMLFHLLLILGSYGWVHSVSTLPQPTHNLGVPGTFYALKRIERKVFVLIYIFLALIDIGIWWFTGGDIYLVTAIAMVILPFMLLAQRVVNWMIAIGAVCFIAYALFVEPSPLPPVDAGYYLLGILVATPFLLQWWVPLDHLQL